MIIKPFKVDFIDPVDMCVVEDTDSIGLILEDGELKAYYFPYDNDTSFQLMIRVRE